MDRSNHLWMLREMLKKVHIDLKNINCEKIELTVKYISIETERRFPFKCSQTSMTLFFYKSLFFGNKPTTVWIEIAIEEGLTTRLFTHIQVGVIATW